MVWIKNIWEMYKLGENASTGNAFVDIGGPRAGHFPFSAPSLAASVKFGAPPLAAAEACSGLVLLWLLYHSTDSSSLPVKMRALQG